MSLLNQIGRHNQILIVLLAIQIAVGVAVFWPRTVASDTGGPLLAEFSAQDVVELIISDGDDNRLALTKQGDDWVLSEAGDYPAKSEDVISLLEKIEGVQTNRLVTQTEASHNRLGVAGDDFNRRLEITLADGSSHNLFIGSSGGAAATHVRADNQAEVYLTGELTAFEANAQASGWIETLYFSLPQTATTKLTLENENGTFEFVRVDDSWTLTGLADDEVLMEGAVTTLLGQASSVRMTAPIGTEAQAAFGLDNPSATITLETRSTSSGQAPDETFILKVGAQDPDDNSYYFNASNSPYFVQVSEFTGNNFVNKTRDDFLEIPPTPEAETESSESK